MAPDLIGAASMLGGLIHAGSPGTPATKEAKEETLDEMFKRVAADMRRRGDANREGGNNPRNAALARKWARYAACVDRGKMPFNPTDTDLTMTYGQELARAIREGRSVDGLTLDDDGKATDTARVQ